MNLLRGLLWAVLLVSLATCQVQPTLAPVALDTPTPVPPTQTPTRTPVWFPPTETPTAQPSLTAWPTQDARPGLAGLVLQDDFSSGGWQAFSVEAGRAALGKNELTLAIQAPKGVLTSFRAAPLPGDGYLELTATPSLCKGSDVFGIYLRAASPGDGYRLLATCSGLLRLERLKNQELVLLQDWTPGIGLIPGGMLPVRLGIWAAGRELRVFVNAVYQFSVRDPVWSEGMLGVYARAAGDSPLTVSFSQLEVRQLDPARIPSATPPPTPKP